MSVFTKIHYQDVREISLRSRKSQGRWKSKKWPPWTENLQNIGILYSWHSLIQTFKRNQSNVHIFSVDKCMFSIQICGYFDDWDYETGGKSKIYYNKGFQRKPGGNAFDKKMCLVCQDNWHTSSQLKDWCGSYQSEQIYFNLLIFFIFLIVTISIWFPYYFQMLPLSYWKARIN